MSIFKTTVMYYFLIMLFCSLISCQEKKTTPNKSIKEEVAGTPQILQLKVAEEVVTLDKQMFETSGLINDNGTLWTHNDSGNKSDLYQFNSSDGSIIKKIRLDKVKNNDWEEIAVDSQFLYVGDIGNNGGSRKNLRINRLDKSLLYSSTGTIKEQEVKIKFTYPNQPDKLKDHNHDFDSEAFLALDDRLYIFTKNWKSQKCDLYSIPNQEGEWEARLMSSFDTKGLITSATFLGDKSTIVLLGYNKGSPQRSFIWVLSGYQADDFFSGHKVRYNLNVRAQTEAIADKDGSTVYITAEGGRGRNPRLFQLTLP